MKQENAVKTKTGERILLSHGTVRIIFNKLFIASHCSGLFLVRMCIKKAFTIGGDVIWQSAMIHEAVNHAFHLHISICPPC